MPFLGLCIEETPAQQANFTPDNKRFDLQQQVPCQQDGDSHQQLIF